MGVKGDLLSIEPGLRALLGAQSLAGNSRRPRYPRRSALFCSVAIPPTISHRNFRPAYGYYYQPVTFLGLVGAQVDATAGKLDARAQFVNSSPANRRTIFESDQRGNWAGGVVLTPFAKAFASAGPLITGRTWIANIRSSSLEKAELCAACSRQWLRDGWSSGASATGIRGERCSISGDGLPRDSELSRKTWDTAKCGGR